MISGANVFKKSSNENMLHDDLLLENYDFVLPNELIAMESVYPKEDAKLLVYQNGNIIHTTFKNLFDFIPKNYHIILNDTKVIKARLFATKLTGSCIQQDVVATREIFYHKALSDREHLVQIRGKTKLFDCFVVECQQVKVCIQVVSICNDGYRVVTFFTLTQDLLESYSIATTPIKINTDTYLNQHMILSLLEECGKIPLPPYIKRESNEKDLQDYQSVFANMPGSVAAPTASLHFSEAMFDFLRTHYHHSFVTLHVGAGTFKPVSVDNILKHEIHSEYCFIPQDTIRSLLESEHILCVGTTAMRSVEWFLHKQSMLKQYEQELQAQRGELGFFGENNIFLHPVNPPKRVRSLLTNFHLPKSSLIMLVSSIIGRAQTLEIYKEAIKHNYRFYSYGDGMLII